MKLKLILYNAGIAAIAIPLFIANSFALLKNPVAAIAVGSALIAACVIGNQMICKNNNAQTTDTNSNYRKISTEFLYTANLNSLTAKLHEFTGQPITDVCQECTSLTKQTVLFYKKRNALRTLTGDESYETTNAEIKDVLTKNLISVSKRIILIESASDTEETNEHLDFIRNIIAKNDHLLDQYSDLITEVSQIGDNDTSETINSLAAITETLKEFRLDDNNWVRKQQRTGTENTKI